MSAITSQEHDLTGARQEAVDTHKFRWRKGAGLGVWGDLIREGMKYVRKCAESLLCLLRQSTQDIISTAAISHLLTHLYKVPLLQLSYDLFLRSNCNGIMLCLFLTWNSLHIFFISRTNT